MYVSLMDYSFIYCIGYTELATSDFHIIIHIYCRFRTVYFNVSSCAYNFYVTVIVGINFKHVLNSEFKSLRALKVAKIFSYLVIYIEHDLCLLSYQLNINSIVCSVCRAITSRLISISLSPIFNIYMYLNFW